MSTQPVTFSTADQSSPGHYGPSRTALLLLDFHTMFVQKAGGPNAPAALNVAIQVRTWAKSQGIAVVHALIDVSATPAPTSKGAERLGAYVAALKNSGAEEPAALLQGSREGEVTFIRRPGYVSALVSPGMLDFLEDKGIKSLILTGLSTSGCVMRTAIPATDADFIVTVISDACADAGEGVHDMVVGKLLPSRAYVTTAAQFQEGYAKAIGGQ